MNGCSGKRGGGGLMAPRKGYNIKNSVAEKDQNVQFCNRIGCNGRMKYSQSTRVGSLDKAKSLKPAFHSSNGNRMTGNSSSSSSSATTAKRPGLDSKRKLSPDLALDPPAQPGVPDVASSSSSSSTTYESEITRKSGKGIVTEIGSCSGIPSHRSPKTFYHKSRSRDQNTAPTSSALIPKNSSLKLLNNSSGDKSGYGLSNLKCNSISDVVPPTCSSSDSVSVRNNVAKNKSAEGESSLSRRGRKSTVASLVDGNICPASSNISISDSRRGGSSSREDSTDSASGRYRRAMNMNFRMRLSYRQNGRNISAPRDPHTPSGVSQIPDSDVPFNVGERSLSQLFTTNVPSSSSSSYSLSSSNDENASRFTARDLGFTHFMNRDALRRYNMDGIAEVLLALERIEQTEDLTREQVHALETSLFLSGLNFYDQHRDLRLDIDNMSYEELLALEERMGTVSTALPEEALSKCVLRSLYDASEVRVTGTGKDKDDIKCSICQEEYETGDEIGKLVECQHGYHALCINQWLSHKNWCPICKAAVAPSQTPLSSE